jgi:nucleotidyltransferase-like protein
VVDQAIVDSVQNYLRHLGDQGFTVSFAVVFGSQTKGSSHEWSDIDLLVVSPRFDDSLERDDINRLWRTAARTDSRIEPVPCGARQWIDDTSKAIIEIARREGTRVLPAA